MCGIIGAVAKRDITNTLISGLKRLEYRGYDSAGIAVINDQQIIERQRAAGKVATLENLLRDQPLSGNTGIAHTRWATHGIPSERNAHPHIFGGEIALVHNGIIENHECLREQLQDAGYHFSSDTDTETVGHLLHQELKRQPDFIQAVLNISHKLEGAYALGIIYRNDPHRIIVVRRGCPLIIGIGENEHFIASDSFALLPITKRFIYLEEGDVADIQQHKITIYDLHGQIVERPIRISETNGDIAEKGKYRHYMLKEIYEQPRALVDTLEGRLTDKKILPEVFGANAAELFAKAERIQIVACGTSYHAGLVARYWLEEMAGIPCQVEVASEIRYRKHVVSPNTLFVTISQSGETADTLAALRQAKQAGYLACLAICNVADSSLVREADLAFMTRAGIEIGVASTKAFTTQLLALLMLTLTLKQVRYPEMDIQHQLKQLLHLPRLIEESLRLDSQIQQLAQLFADKQHSLFLGRGAHYPIALEGALKLKEISYIHAEAYPAGELKHGPLALVDKNMPVVAIAPHDNLLEKIKSNLYEVLARGGQLIVFTDQESGFNPQDGLLYFSLPSVSPMLAPIVYTIPLQLLAYHVAVLKGTDIDQPRNLAKSVTVE